MGASSTRVLLIDSDQDYYLLTKQLLTHANGEFSLDWLHTIECAQEAIACAEHDVYLIDDMLGNGSGVDLLRYARSVGCKAPMIMLTSQVDGDVDSEALSAGASDYLLKGQIDARGLERSIRYSLEQSRTMKALEESQERLRTVVANAPVVLFALDANGTITFIEGAGLNALGVTPDQIVGTPFPELFANYPGILADFERACNGESFTTHAVLSGINFDCKVRPSLDADGNVIGIFGVAIDVTDRVMIEEALRTSEERFRVALKHAPIIVFNQDKELRYTWFHSPGLGYGSDAVVGYTDSDLVPQENLNEIERIKRSVLETGIGRREEVRIGMSVGSIYDLTVEPLRDDTGDIAGVTCAAIDITYFKNIQESLRQSEHRFRTLANTAPVLIWMSDEGGGCTYFNEPWVSFTGRPVDELLGNGWAEDVHPEDRRRCVENYRSTFEAKENCTMQYRLRRYDGVYRWVLDTGVPRHTPEGEFAGYIGSCIDITDRVLAEERLEESRRLNDAILQSLSAHIAVVDSDGIIMAINSAWERFGAENGLYSLTRAGTGANYLEVCRRSVSNSSQEALEALRGIEAVLAGEVAEFTMEYSCHTPQRKAWFLMSATALAGLGGAVISHTDITERRQAVEALRESQQLFQTFMDNSQAISFVQDGQARYVYVNRQFAQWVGDEAENLIGRTQYDILPTDIAIQFAQNHTRVLENREPLEKICTINYKGEERYWFISVFPLRDSSGKILVGGTAIDISEQIRAEESLRKSEERFQYASRATNDAIWDWDLATNALTWNINVHRLFRYSADEGVSDIGWWKDQIHPDDRERVLIGIGRVIEQQRQFWREEYRFRRGDGTFAYVLDRGYLVLDEEGKPVRMIGAMTDLTRRKEVEDALRRSEERYRRIVETAYEGIWIIDTDGKTTFANVRMGEILGYTPEEMSERTVFDFLDADGRAMAREYMRQRRSNGTQQLDFKFIRKDGSFVWTILSASSVIEKDGSDVGTLAMVSDITARKLAEDALQEAHDKLEMRVAERTAEIVDVMARLEQAHQMQQRFVADASHDLRTPLTVVRAELDLLLHRAEHDHRTRESLVRIATESRRLEDLASDLLLLATIDASQITALTDRVHLDGLIFDCVEQLTTLAREKNISWDVQIDEPVELGCNASMLSRAVINILENAIKYSNDGSQVAIQLHVHDGEATVVITDNGIGIPENDLPRVFDRFYRGDLTRNTSGTGLGLAIVKAVADAHRGSAGIESKPGIGTTVRMTFPIA